MSDNTETPFDPFSANILAVLAEVRLEALRAAARYGGFTSSHEALGVLVEEVSELTDAIHANSLESIRAEAIQVAAVALRLAQACRDDAAFRERSGC